MKILHIIYTNGIGGAEKHLKYLLPGIKNQGIDCELLILCPPASLNILSKFAEEIKAEGVNSTVISIKHNISIKTLTVVKNFLLKNKFLIVHSHLLRTDLIVSMIKQFYINSLFIISTKHGYQEKVLTNYTPLQPKIKKDLIYYVTKYTLSKINKNISVSKYISQLFMNLNLSKEIFPVIYHGVNVDNRFTEKDYNYKKSDIQLIIVGRLEKCKGHIYAFKAFKIITEKYPDAKLVIVGDGSMKDSLKMTREELGLTEKISFLGFQKNPSAFICQSDVIIIPSHFESFGLVFIEAMALRVPIVAFDVPAGNEILTNGKTALLSKKDDIELLAQNILTLLDNKEKNKYIANNAFKTFQENFTINIMIKNTVAFYNELHT